MAARRRTNSTPEQLRADIDSGRTGEKVRALDPSAAPLGTDAEAAGTPLSDDEIETARREARSAAPEPVRDWPLFKPLLSGTVSTVVYLGALAVLLWAMFS